MIGKDKQHGASQAPQGAPEPAELPEPCEPGEEDATVTPCGPLGARTAAAFGSRFLGEYAEEEDALEAIAEAMRAAQFWPDVWQISDHGNAALISSRFYAERETGL